MKIHIKPSRKGFTLVELLVVMAIIAILASIATPLILDKRKDADRTKAIANATQINVGMIAFLSDHGVRPGASATNFVSGSSAALSNDAFRQMLQGTTSVRTETIFFAPSLISTTPDDDIGTEEDGFANACGQGEVGFLYVDAPDSKSGAPLLGAPLVNGSSAEFNTDTYNGKAVFLKTDGSVVSLDIDDLTSVVNVAASGGEVDILSPTNPIYRTAPSILLPEPR